MDASEPERQVIKRFLEFLAKALIYGSHARYRVFLKDKK
jgi:hypothetical protein